MSELDEEYAVIGKLAVSMVHAFVGL